MYDGRYVQYVYYSSHQGFVQTWPCYKDYDIEKLCGNGSLEVTLLDFWVDGCEFTS